MAENPWSMLHATPLCPDHPSDLAREGTSNCLRFVGINDTLNCCVRAGNRNETSQSDSEDMQATHCHILLADFVVSPVHIEPHHSRNHKTCWSAAKRSDQPDEVAEKWNGRCDYERQNRESESGCAKNLALAWAMKSL